MSVNGINETTQFLSFQLEEEEFALEITRVREVLDVIRITRVPRTPDFLKGVINLRGAVVPVVDLRLKFGMNLAEQTVHTRIVIGEVEVDGEMTVIGALADAVHEVMDLEPEQIEPAPRLGTRLNTDFIKGMGKKDEEFIMILDIDRIFSAEEIALLNATGERKEPDAE